ncbi:hypothetical protein LCGC14_0748790 [marine sediment metagenome]|uniref:Uncharacterized protein n=1 Tax=marine sediment metagenome TaxID=412755 RepID=A0A0F9TBM4_9ZZZZ
MLRRMGRPSAGLTAVIFTRCKPALKELIEKERKRVQKENPHRPVSEADIVRRILYKHFKEKSDDNG